VEYHVTHGFEPKTTHTHNVSSRPKPKRSPLKVHDGFINQLSKLWSKLTSLNHLATLGANKKYRREYTHREKFTTIVKLQERKHKLFFGENLWSRRYSYSSSTGLWNSTLFTSSWRPGKNFGNYSLNLFCFK